MPLYTFVRVDKPKIQEDFFFTMKEAPKVDDVITDDDGVQWKRIFTLPYASVDSQINPDSVNDFVEKTGKKKGTLGNIFDASKELSEKRAKQRGEDPVQKKFFENYKKQRFGVKHLEELKKTKTEKTDFSITYN